MSEPLSTGCAPLDDLLGGGFERGTVTQLYGPPAAGKTNVALAAVARVAAAGDRALYLDTEGLSVERFRQLARGVDGDPDRLASRVVITDAYDFAAQEEAVRDAEEFAAEVELVVLDSATGHYRLERTDDDGGETLRRVGKQVRHLLSLARKHDLAVVVTNQVFTDPDSNRPRALGGHTLDHWTGVVVRLDRFRGGKRRATLEKHHAREAGGTVPFRITADGVEGVDRPDG
ncbi:MAG: DNA repair and recombination protein RadB [Haloferacaceae archaeon]